MSNAIENLKAAKLSLLTKRPYFTSAIFALNCIKKDVVGTLGVDKRWNLYYNEEFTESLSREHLEGILVHEIWHLLRSHFLRCLNINANPKIWNFAADAEINDDLMADGLKLPDTCVFPSSFELPENLTAEEYYNEIMNKIDKFSDMFNDNKLNPGCGNCGSAAHGSFEEWETEGQNGEGLTEGESELVKRQVAEEMSKNIGNLPGYMQKWVEETLGPAKVDWRKELYSQVNNSINSWKAGSTDYTFTRRSRRHHNSDIIFPSMFDLVPNFAVIIDTSGSISEKDLSDFLSEISGILAITGQGSVRVLACDAEVHSDIEVRSLVELQDKIIGGGGTDMGVAIEYLEKDSKKPNICIVLTDGYTPWPENEPSFDVIAVVTTDQIVPSWIKGIWLDGYIREGEK